MSPPSDGHQKLKHLAFVQSGCSKAERIYCAVRAAAVPSGAIALVDALEGQLMARVAPLAQELLLLADMGVDGVVIRLHEAMQQSQAAVSKSGLILAPTLLQAAAFASSSPASMPSLQQAREALALRYSALRAAALKEDAVDQAVHALLDAWAGFARLPLISQALTTLETATSLGSRAAAGLQARLVSSPLYKAALDRAAAVASYAARSLPAQYLLPRLRPYTEPCLLRAQNSKYISYAVSCLQPVEASA